ncbi:peptidoglycan-binding protein [Streptomyces sp. NPDC127092]|uniref:peptidoglycan-binding protein n=1 Tax=Streptomyces sp. NPDC127092 TaxID=3347135 RepID=UPI003657F614
MSETRPPRGSRSSRSRRALLLVTAALVVAATVTVGRLGLGGDPAESAGAPPREGSTVRVTRATLTERTSLEGRLGYGAETPLPVKATGTVTWLPAPGTTVQRGEELLRVDDRPVVLLYGALPMYRDLGLTTADTTDGRRPDADTGTGTGTGTGPKGGGTPSAPPSTTSPSAPPSQPQSPSSSPSPSREMRGTDVLQFETNLATLGYTGFTVDSTFTAGTARAVKRWQKSLGLPQTGTVGVGDVVYSSGGIRTGKAGVRLGAAVSENVLTHTGTARKAVVDTSAQEASWAVRGTRVTVELPDGRTVRGKVASVGTEATEPEGGGGGGGGENGGAPTVPVTVTIEDQQTLGRLESGPVTVTYVGRERKDVLTVPVSALVALAEGGHGLETADGTFVAVKTGLFADGDVEISGPAVREGLEVRIPR